MCLSGLQLGNPLDSLRSRPEVRASSTLNTRRAHPQIQARPGGFEPPTDGLEIRRRCQPFLGNAAVSTPAGPATGPECHGTRHLQSLARGTITSIEDEELLEIIIAWQTLSATIKRAMLALIRSID